MPQYARPASDVSTGSWTAAPLWSKIDDDLVATPNGDGSTVASNNNINGDPFVCALTSGHTDPLSSTSHTLRVRWNKSASGGHTIDAVIELFQGDPGSGGSLIASTTVNGISETEQLTTLNLTGTQADSITNYNTLHVRVTRNGSTGGSGGTRRSLVVEAVEFEFPSAATPKSGTDTNGSVSESGGVVVQPEFKEGMEFLGSTISDHEVVGDAGLIDSVTDGDSSWGFLSGAGASDDFRAEVNLGPTGDLGERSEAITAQDFGITLPVGAQITGIVVTVEGHFDGMDFYTAEVSLLDDTGTKRGLKSTTTGFEFLNDQVVTFGGSEDDWGQTDFWTKAIIESSNFGAYFVVENRDAFDDLFFMVDRVKVSEVHYEIIGSSGLVESGSVTSDGPATKSGTDTDGAHTESASPGVAAVDGLDVDGPGSEVATPTYPAVGTDSSGAGTDVGTPSGQLPGTDQRGSVVDTAALAAAAPGTDASGTPTELGGPVAVQAGADQPSPTVESAASAAAASAADASGGVVESTGLTQFTSAEGSDVASGLDAATIQALALAADLAGAVDETTLLSILAGVDIGSASDLAQALILIFGLDTGSATDIATVLTAKLGQDAPGVTSEVAALLSLLSTGDLAAAVDLASELAVLPGADVSGGTVESGSKTEEGGTPYEFPQAPVVDPYDRANGGLGANYTHFDGTSGATIVDETARGAGYTAVYWNAEMVGPRVEMRLRLRAGAGAYNAVFARLDPVNFNGYEVAAGPGGISLNRRDLAESTPLATSAYIPGSDEELAIVADGDTLEAWTVSALGVPTLRATAEDSTYQDEGRVGWAIYDPQSDEPLDDLAFMTIVVEPTLIEGADAASASDSGEKSEGVVPKNLLLVVADAAVPDTMDQKLQELAEDIGHIVTLRSDETADSVVGFDGVVIAESVSSGTIAGKYASAAVPVVDFEALNVDELGMGTASLPTGGQTQLFVEDDTHPIMDGPYGSFTGTVTVLASSGRIGETTSLASGMTPLAQKIGGSATDYCVAACDAGATLTIGPAPAKRAMLLIANTTGGAPLSADGEAIVKNAFAWAFGTGGEAPTMKDGSDVSAGAETGQISAAIAALDTAVSSEQVAVQVVIATTDESGDTVEVGSATVVIFTSDTGTATEVGQVSGMAVTISGTDVAHGSDLASMTRAAAVLDLSGTPVELGSFLVSLAGSDAAAALEGALVTAAVSAPDSVVVVDLATLLSLVASADASQPVIEEARTLLSGLDTSGVPAETGAASASLTGAETAVAGETADLTVMLPALDVGLSLETAVILIRGLLQAIATGEVISRAEIVGRVVRFGSGRVRS